MMSNGGCGALGVGLVLGGASILSVGPCNLMLMREGMIRGRVSLVASSVWISNLALLTAALALTDSIARDLLPLRSVLTLLGAAAVAWFAFRSFRCARLAGTGEFGRSNRMEKATGCVRRALATVWFNPLFYIELLLIPASICDGFKDPWLRLQFALGLGVMITIKVFGYAFAASSCASYVKPGRSLQCFDLASGLMLSCVAAVMTARLVLQAV